MNLRNEKTEVSGTTSQDVGRLAISFPAPNRNASQVQLRSVSSLFRRPNNRIQIRISVRETTAAVRFAVQQTNKRRMFLFFLQRPAILCPERQQNRHSGRAVQRSVNQGIVSLNDRRKKCRSFDGPKRLVPFGRNRFAGRRE